MSNRATAATRTRHIDIHPIDTAARHATMQRLFGIRTNTTSRAKIAPALGISVKGVWAFEHEPEPNPLLEMAQRYARTLRYRLTLTPSADMTPDPNNALVAMYARKAANTQNPAEADEWHRMWLLAHLVSVRTTAGITQAQLADTIGCSESAVAQAEQGNTNPWLSTYQRHARAIGIPLTLHLEPVNDVQAALAA